MAEADMGNQAVTMLEKAGYIPAREKWTPVDEALYGVEKLFRIKKERADKLLLNAAKFSVDHWFNNSGWYHVYCNEFDFKPDHIKTKEDLVKIPVVSHRFFKTYLEGPEFSKWISQITIGEIEEPKITERNPTLDDVIEAYDEKGLLAAYSSGTSGRFSFIPKDGLTFNRSQYCLGKMGISEILGEWYDPEAYAFLLGPNPSKTNMWVGKVVSLMDHVYRDVQYAFDRDITTQIVRLSLGDTKGFSERLMATVMKLINTTHSMIPRIIEWLEERYENGDKVFIAEAPFILQALLSRLEEEGKTFDFGDRGAIITGGGWKTHQEEKIPLGSFRKKVEEVLGVPEELNVDLYTMVESNWHAIHCPEGHYLHMPPSIVYPMVLDQNYQPLGYGDTGRFAFIDTLANSYPGAIVTGDMVTLHEECPACGRTGPVLEPEVSRASGEEIRGCAEEMRRLMDEQTPELLHDLVCTPDRSRMPMMLIDRET